MSTGPAQQEVDAGSAPSVDREEVAYYTRLAQTWWDLSGPFWPLHRLNGLRVGYIAEAATRHFGLDRQAARPLEGLRVLDIGCGGGILSEAIARLGAEVVGIDVVERNLVVARQHAAASDLALSYRQVSAEQLAGEGASFPLVLNMEVVEHVADLPGFLDACARLVAPGGLMVIATINRTLLSWLFAIIGAEYVLRWLPRGTHRWRRFRRPRELEDLLRPTLRPVSRAGVRVNPLTRRFALTRILAVNYMLVLERPAAPATPRPVLESNIM